MWFVGHVVYGLDLYFLEFDELQIKQDQMNGPVSVGYTCAALWFSVLVILNAHRHTHKCALMLEYIDCLFYGRSFRLSLNNHRTRAVLLPDRAIM